MTHDKQRCVEIPETIRSKQPSVKVFYYHINILLADQCLRGINTPLKEIQKHRYFPSMGFLKAKTGQKLFLYVLLILEILGNIFILQIIKPSNNYKNTQTNLI